MGDDRSDHVVMTSAADGAIDEQGEHRTDDGTDDAGCLKGTVIRIVMGEDIPEETADEGPDDAEHHGAADGHRVLSRNECSGNEACDEADDHEIDDETKHD